MLRHYITKYKEGDRYYAESWLQLELFGRCGCFYVLNMTINCFDKPCYIVKLHEFVEVAR